MTSKQVESDASLRQFLMRVVCLSLAAQFLVLSPAGATSVCRWVDKSGKTQFSDMVPKDYSDTAICAPVDVDELTPEQRADAERRRLQTIQINSRVPPQASPAPVVSQVPPLAVTPPSSVSGSSQCQEQWRRFDESGACFARFRVFGGGLRPEAFSVCREVLQPELSCARPSN